MAYKRIYTIGSLSLLGIFLAIAPFIETYYNYEDVVYCTENCVVDFCLKNGNKDLYFYNKENLPLTFYPEGKVTDVKFYKKDGRAKSGYREIDFITPYSKGTSYVFKIDAYKTSCYRMEITKKAWADVKWSFGELDPVLLSGTQIGDYLVKEVCIPTYFEENEYIKKTCYYNESIISTALTVGAVQAKNGSYYKTTEKSYQCNVLNATKQVHTDCIKTGKINLSGEVKGKEGFFGKLEGTKVCFYSNKEGGAYAIKRDDNSVDKQCKDLITEKIEITDNLKSGVRIWD